MVLYFFRNKPLYGAFDPEMDLEIMKKRIDEYVASDDVHELIFCAEIAFWQKDVLKA